MNAQVFRCLVRSVPPSGEGEDLSGIEPGRPSPPWPRSATSVLGLALAMGVLGCGKGNPTEAGASGGLGAGGSATGGTVAGTGGATPSTGGVVGGTGGGNTGAGGLTSAGGATATGGGAAGAGGGAGTGGRGGGTTATGGAGASDAGADAGTRDGPIFRNDGSTKSDLASEVAQAKDGTPAAVAEVALGDGPPALDGGVTVPTGYKLVWSDEFDVDGAPNSKNWNYEKGFARNEELQWYQSDNASVKGGLLVIEARKERVSNPNYKAGSSDWKTSRQYAEYTSTSMTGSGLQSWQYGRFELRARIPTSAGMWPAWWTLGVSGEWPSNGEIDIMEYYKGKVLANVACGTATQWQAKWDSSSKAVSSLGTGWASNFHTWRMDWDDQKIDLYLDDTLMNSAALSSMLNADGKSPFKQKAYMLINLALGGVNGGDPAGTTFPQKYEVDWVRVFQKQ